MIREIKFRAKRHDASGWVYGSLVIHKHLTVTHYIQERPHFIVPVHPETVGQYTGLKDKKGVEIYEGDIVTCNFETGEEKTGHIEYWPNHMSYVLVNKCNQNIGRTRDMWSASTTIKELPHGGIDGVIISTIHDKETNHE